MAIHDSTNAGDVPLSEPCATESLVKVPESPFMTSQPRLEPAACGTKPPPSSAAEAGSCSSTEHINLKLKRAGTSPAVDFLERHSDRRPPASPCRQRPPSKSSAITPFQNLANTSMPAISLDSRRRSSSGIVETHDTEANLHVALRFGAAEDIGGRRQMEDRIVSNLDIRDALKSAQDSPYKAALNLPSQRSFFGVLDGHDGVYAAVFAADHLLGNVLQHSSFSRDIPEAMVRVAVIAANSARGLAC